MSISNGASFVKSFAINFKNEGKTPQWATGWYICIYEEQNNVEVENSTMHFYYGQEF